MKKVLGYVLSLLGILTLTLTIDKVREITKITFLQQTGSFQITLVALVLIIAGIFLVVNETKNTPKEVPIYQGKEVVGYRRH